MKPEVFEFEAPHIAEWHQLSERIMVDVVIFILPERVNPTLLGAHAKSMHEGASLLVACWPVIQIQLLNYEPCLLSHRKSQQPSY